MSPEQRKAYLSSPESLLFKLRVPGAQKGDPSIMVEARDSGERYLLDGRTKILVRVVQGRKEVFPLGQLYCGVGAGQTDDGPEARAHALFLVSMKPGDTDEEYFDGYSPEQLTWAEHNGEWLSLLVHEREERAAKRRR
jgi:hypothetical protein